MRLTLRTLLAYLDDVLESADAREIGEKLGDSKEARELVARIREVLRRRRIGAPELAGPGSGPDPNLVADYLENSLPPAQVVELERLCQSSDLHLAEVAACHKILTMILGQPMDVPDEFRERMYALGATSPREAAVEEPPAAMAEGMEQTIEGHALRDGLPEYLTRSGNARRYWTILGILGVAIAWLLLLVNDRSLWPSGEDIAKSVTPVSGESKESGVAVVAPGAAVPAPVAGQGPTLSPASPSAPVAAGGGFPVPPGGGFPMATAPSEGIPNLPPPHAGGFPPPPPPPFSEFPGSTPPPPPPMIVTSPPSASPETVNPPAAPAPASLPEVELHYLDLGGDEIVLQQLTPTAPWRVIDSQTPIHPGEEIATPVPFRNEYALDSLCTLTLEPGSRIRRLSRDSGCDFALELVRGRMIITRTALTNTPVVLRLQIAQQAWLISLADPDTRCGIEFVPPVPRGLPGHASEMEFGGGLGVTTGRVTISVPQGQVQELTAATGFVKWPLQGTSLNTEAGQDIPDWLKPEGTFVTPTARMTARQFQKEFLSDRSITQSIGPVIRDRRAAISELAAQTLALVDRYQDLAPALASEHTETRQAAIQGLRQWLVRDPQNGNLLREELGRSFRQEAVEPILRLLRGFDASDARNVEASRQLVNWLKDDEIAIRELAIFQIMELTGRRNDFFPMAPQAERRAAVSRWEEHLKRNNGALVSGT